MLEENRRLVNRNGPNEIVHGQDTLIPTTNGSVEEAVLQTQIETLQWQLTQVNYQIIIYLFTFGICDRTDRYIVDIKQMRKRV